VTEFPNPFQKYMECRKYPEIAEKIIETPPMLDDEISWRFKDDYVIMTLEADIEHAKRYKPEMVEVYKTYLWALKLSMKFIKGDIFVGYAFTKDERPFEVWVEGKTLKDLKLKIVDVVRFAKTQWDACVKHSNICTCDCTKPETYCQLGTFVLAPTDIDVGAKALLASTIITSELGVSVEDVLKKLKGKD
jgi:hypothetical protein